MITTNLTVEDYVRALQAQRLYAVDGILNDLHATMPRIQRDCVLYNQPASWMAAHPIVRMYAKRLAELCDVSGYRSVGQEEMFVQEQVDGFDPERLVPE